MAEMERTRERERPPIKDNPYEAVLRQRAELKERNLKGPVVIRAEDREILESHRVGGTTRRKQEGDVHVPDRRKKVVALRALS